MRSLLARNETARFTTISGFKSYIFLINQSFWTGSLCFSNRKYTKIADSIKKSADIHYHVNKNTVLLIWCVALGQYIVIWATFCIKQKCVQIPPYLPCTGLKWRTRSIRPYFCWHDNVYLQIFYWNQEFWCIFW